MSTRLALAAMWLLHFLPLPLLRAVGALFGLLLFAFGHERRHIALTNLGLCFPCLDPAARARLARRHFIAFAQGFLDRGLFWWASPARLRRLIRIEGLEHLPPDGSPVLLLAPHFVGLDAGWTRLTLERRLASVYANQKNPDFNLALYRGRTRFNSPLLLSRQMGLRRVVRAVRDGLPFYYLPDMDFGRDDSIFVPFFGVPAATITGVSRLAALAGARVVPCVTRMTADGYVLRFEPPWDDYPGGDLAADTRRVNAEIEAWIATMPEQYFWLHKRFKTRPEGEPSVY